MWYSAEFGAALRGKLGKPRMTRISRISSWLASDTDALHWMPDWARRVRQPRYGLRFCIRVIRAICGEFYFGAGFTAAFPRRVFGKRDRRATDPRSDRV